MKHWKGAELRGLNRLKDSRTPFAIGVILSRSEQEVKDKLYEMSVIHKDSVPSDLHYTTYQIDCIRKILLNELSWDECISVEDLTVQKIKALIKKINGIQPIARKPFTRQAREKNIPIRNTYVEVEGIILKRPPAIYSNQQWNQ